jgi:hypothetical protein
MDRAIILGDAKKIDNDVELCRTTNARISDRTAQLLMENRIPFTRNWERIPFFKRERYKGAKCFYVIGVNRNRYVQARHTIDQLDPPCRRRLILSNF